MHIVDKKDKITLDEAIKYAEQMVEIGETYEVSTGVEEYRQLAEWLKELKAYRAREEKAIRKRCPMV